MPPGSELKLIWDGSTEIRTSLAGVQEELISAVFLTAVVLLLFLHRFRVSLIVLLSIPTTLLATLVAMQLLGFSFNILSTLGLTLTIGILVDDSIVVLENILRRLAGGDPPEQAAINGRAEIGLAAVAITLVDVVVFVPVGLVTGQIGGFFREFGFTIAAATLFSLVVSFTLTPMLAGRLLRRQSRRGRGPRPLRLRREVEPRVRPARARLPPLLHFGLGHRLLMVARRGRQRRLRHLPDRERPRADRVLPRSDQGRFIVSTEMPPGTSLERHDRLMAEVETRLLALPEVDTVTASIGASQPGRLRRSGSARPAWARRSSTSCRRAPAGATSTSSPTRRARSSARSAASRRRVERPERRRRRPADQRCACRAPTRPG